MEIIVYMDLSFMNEVSAKSIDFRIIDMWGQFKKQKQKQNNSSGVNGDFSGMQEEEEKSTGRGIPEERS